MTGKDKAKQLYENGCKYKDIAEQLDISINTVKSWRTREKWTRKKSATKDKKVAPKIKKVAKKVAPVKLSAVSSADDKWKQFCLLYLQRHNATQAYMNVYDTDYETATTGGSRLLRNDKVKSYLDDLRAEQAKELYLSALDVQREQAKIAYANLSDYIEIKTISQERIDADGNAVVDVDGQPIVDTYNEIVATDPAKVDYSIVKSVHRGKDGLVLELYDKQKALEFLSKNLADTAQARIDKAKADSLDTDNNEQMNSIDNLLNKLDGDD